MKNSLLIIFLLLSGHLFGQLSFSGSDNFRYGTGKQSFGNFEKDFEYLENILDLKLNYDSRFTLGVRFLYDNPPEIGKKFIGLDRRFLEYNSGDFSFRIGSGSTVFGKGLVLNIFEDRGLGFNTWLDGFIGGYQSDKIKTTLLAGLIKYDDISNFDREEEYEVYGGNFEYSFSEFIAAGASYIKSYGKNPGIDIINESDNNLAEFYLKINDENYEAVLNYAYLENKDELSGISKDGYGIYGSFSFFNDKLGLTIDYKNYQFNLSDPFRRYDNTRLDKSLPFQNPPIVLKEHSYKLLSRPLHEVDFNDEVGIQAELYYFLNDNFSLNLNFSVASRHNEFLFSTNNFQFSEIKRESNYLPSMEDKFSPYYEIYSEGEYILNTKTTLKAGVTYRDKVFYNEITGSAGIHKIESIVVPAYISHIFSENLSVQFNYQFEKRNDNFNTSQENFNNHYFYLFTTLFNKLSLIMRYENTSNKVDVSGKDNWLSGEIGYRIDGGKIVSAIYGSERGGLVCANGVCRYLLPFKGFRLNIQTIF